MYTGFAAPLCTVLFPDPARAHYTGFTTLHKGGHPNMRRDFQKTIGKFDGINENTHCVDLLGGPSGGGELAVQDRETTLC